MWMLPSFLIDADDDLTLSSNRFENTPLATPNGDILIRDLSFEVKCLPQSFSIVFIMWMRDPIAASDILLTFFCCSGSVKVKSGTNVLVCGPNGCGKSSLFRVLGEVRDILTSLSESVTYLSPNDVWFLFTAAPNEAVASVWWKSDQTWEGKTFLRPTGENLSADLRLYLNNCACLITRWLELQPIDGVF